MLGRGGLLGAGPAENLQRDQDAGQPVTIKTQATTSALGGAAAAPVASTAGSVSTTPKPYRPAGKTIDWN